MTRSPPCISRDTNVIGLFRDLQPMISSPSPRPRNPFSVGTEWPCHLPDSATCMTAVSITDRAFRGFDRSDQAQVRCKFAAVTHLVWTGSIRLKAGWLRYRGRFVGMASSMFQKAMHLVELSHLCRRHGPRLAQIPDVTGPKDPEAVAWSGPCLCPVCTV